MAIAYLRAIILVSLTSLISLPASAASNLDQDCSPKGWLPQLRAWWKPENFWSAQIPAIRQEVESRAKGYQIYLVQRQADVAIAATEREKARIEEASLEEQVRILGIQSKPISPETSEKLEQALAKADETLSTIQTRLDEAERQGVVNTIHWGEKCVGLFRRAVIQDKTLMPTSIPPEARIL